MSGDGCDLQGVCLANERLPGIRLPGADLGGASFARADLRCADLRRACLADARMTGADLRGANLAGANLAGADLRGANLQGADLDRAVLDGATLFGAGHDERTRWPAGFQPQQAGCKRHRPRFVALSFLGEGACERDRCRGALLEAVLRLDQEGEATSGPRAWFPGCTLAAHGWRLTCRLRALLLSLPAAERAAVLQRMLALLESGGDPLEAVFADATGLCATDWPARALRAHAHALPLARTLGPLLATWLLWLGIASLDREWPGWHDWSTGLLAAGAAALAGVHPLASGGARRARALGSLVAAGLLLGLPATRTLPLVLGLTVLLLHRAGTLQATPLPDLLAPPTPTPEPLVALQAPDLRPLIPELLERLERRVRRDT